MNYRIEKLARYWYIFPDSDVPGSLMIRNFIFELTGSTSIEEAHKKIEKIVGYTNDGISPGFKSREDAVKVVNYFSINDLFE